MAPVQARPEAEKARVMMRLHRYKDRQKKWRWTLFASNGRKVACSGEGYSKKAHNERMVRKLFPWMFQ